ncbi:ABC transporter permease [Chitinophagaceae bacterium LB-8]|jgi:drug efflux transport system permease protein|uniref:ABC transporter permease n=1 Tax=Paraflavisolibacter caeni TaxID=2982496 RepID=A0A9X2Y0J0_9BACT|nr:ABC transporter permease [Paraflavisolibacter caeni]MCU7552346.1 ABC transporter permease [Paraflavisolibacter caeni]
MKQFGAFVKKEFYHILRDRRTLFILLGMPVVQIIIFGFALTNEVKNAKVLVFDNAKDVASTSIIHEIDASQYFDVQQNVTSYSQVESAFKRGAVKLAVVFPSGFNNDLEHVNKAPIQLIADASDPNTANTLINYASAIIMDYQDRITNEHRLPYTISTEMRMLYNPQLKGAYTFVPGVMAMVLMLVCTMMTAITIVREKEMGTMEVMLVSPVQPLKVVIAKAVPYLLLSMVNVASILLLSVFVLDVPIHGSLFLLVGESLLFILTCLAFGLLISTVTDSQQIAMFISLVGMFLPTIMLSGFMFPIENMPILLQVISHIIPARWFFVIVTSVMIKGLGLGAIWKETLILMGMMLFLLTLSIKKFKIRLA